MNKPEPMTDEQITDAMNACGDDPLMFNPYDFAQAIIAARDARWQAMLEAPHEAKTHEEKTAYAFGFLKALESVREKT